MRTDEEELLAVLALEAAHPGAIPPRPELGAGIAAWRAWRQGIANHLFGVRLSCREAVAATLKIRAAVARRLEEVQALDARRPRQLP